MTSGYESVACGDVASRGNSFVPRTGRSRGVLEAGGGTGHVGRTAASSIREAAGKSSGRRRAVFGKSSSGSHRLVPGKSLGESPGVSGKSSGSL